MLRAWKCYEEINEMSKTVLADRGSKKRQSAILFFARDFLATEFPSLAPLTGELLAVYVTTTRREARTVCARDPSAAVFVLQDYIHSARVNPSGTPVVIDEGRLRRDRFLPKLERREQEAVIAGLDKLLGEIGKLFDIRIYLDEPVSGYLNDRMTEWVRAQGGVPCHFHTAWLPNHIFFTQDNAQREPIPLNLISDGEARVRKHLENRKQGSGRPLYVLDYTRPWRRWSAAARAWAKGIYRLIRRDPFYMNRDPWPHFFNAKSLFNASSGMYASSAELRAEAQHMVIIPLHYEPEAVLGYLWDGDDQTDLAARLLDLLPDDQIVVLKEHPSQPGALALPKWKNILANPRVKALRGTDSLEMLLAQKATLCSIGSTAVLEAVRLQAPALVVGHPHFSEAPGVTHVPDLDSKSIPSAAHPAEEPELTAWYGRFLDQYCVEGRFLRGNTELNRADEVIAALMARANGC